MSPPDAPDPFAGGGTEAGEAGEAGDGPDDGSEPAEAGEDPGGATGATGDAAPRRRRRRRRRRGESAAGEAGERAAEPPGGRPHPAGHAAPQPPSPPGERRDARPRDPERPGDPRRPDVDRSRDDRHRAGRAGEPGHGRDSREEGGRRRRRGDRGEPRGEHRGAGGRDRDARPAEPAGQAAAQATHAAAAQATADVDAALERYALTSATLDTATLRLDPRRPVAPADDLELDGQATPAIPWGKDDDEPAAEVTLAPDLPSEAPSDDPDPLTHPLLEAASAALGDDIASVVGIRFVAGGRVQWCDAGEADYARGERVVVDSDRGARLAWIAVAPSRRPVRDRGMRRVLRRASEQDLRGERTGEADRAHALRLAKDKAAAVRLPLKVFRVELLGQLGRGARLNVYYTSDERLDLRDFIRELSGATGGGRVELRQLGVRDEAKAVGGIGSCGLTLCCTTWLPDFVPVSIKMAKDQGLVLSPTKVSGQCGRLKCCLVYEQAGYAELRKGLPKLGKRVIGARGEGRVVEVDVLRQRIRVSYGPGDTEVVPAAEVRPMFPSGNQPPAPAAEPADDAGDEAPDDADVDALDGLDDTPAAADAPAPPDEDGPGLPDDDPSTT
ncbi:MAG: hypothetical protein E6J90_41170 [Deltaproteobacteria bacterium]|nr:MAG: hypothetical protein E6J90_41170 [Deltaproteobacteria bacterium]TMQ19197.1 MAG: hypothetical protein E6J91_06585 [Deltaproteobacteria bacterium]